MRITIGVLVFFVSILLFGWWGLVSLLFVLPFIGWQYRHAGPLKTSSNNESSHVTDYDEAGQLSREAPKSFKLMQEILLKAEGKASPTRVLLPMLRDQKDFLNMEFGGDSADKDLLLNYTERFSKVFPNWRQEYLMLLSIIHREF